MAKTLVVARAREDIPCPEADGWAIHTTEPGQPGFANAIARLYPTLAADDLVAFVHDDPDEHSPLIDWRLIINRPQNGHRAIGDHTYVCDGTGAPQYPGIPVAERYGEWVGPFPGAVTYAPGGQFVTDGAAILSRPYVFWKYLAERAADGFTPWVLERLWAALLPGSKQEPLATFYCQATPITTYLRCELPARYLPGKVQRECPVGETEDDFFFPQHEGAAIFQFAGDKQWALTIHGLQHKGHRVLIESDDNYFTVHPHMERTSWVREKHQGGHSLAGHASILKWVDGAIVTTETLAKQYRRHVPHIVVAPNTIDPLDWPRIGKPDDGVFRIGWFASWSHTDDARLVRRALEWASRQDGVEVITMGVNPRWDFPRGHVEWLGLPAYREALHMLDVGVAPVVGTPWAQCRSDLKALEYSMGGAAPVLSSQPPYSNWTDGENCLKANDAGDFYKRIRWLVENRDEAKALAAAAREYVLRERTTVAQIGCWREALEIPAREKVAA